MSLFWATMVTAGLLVGLGAALLGNRPGWRALVSGFARSERAGWVLFGGASVWFLWKVWHLSPADNLFAMDFTRFRLILIGVFGATAVGAFFHVKDLLPIRGLAILLMLFAAEGLSAAFGLYEVPQRLVLVTFLYAVIVFGIVVGAAPYHLRNLIGWLLAHEGRTRAAGAASAALGLVLVATALTY